MYNVLRNVFLTIVTIMNVLILVFFQKKLSFGTSVDDPYFDSDHWILKVIAWILVGIEIIIFIVWTRVKAPLIIRKKLREFYLDLFKQIIDKSDFEGEIPDLRF